MPTVDSVWTPTNEQPPLTFIYIISFSASVFNIIWEIMLLRCVMRVL